MRLLLPTVLVVVMAGGAWADQIESYGWEDGVATILGYRGDIVNPTNVTDRVHTGNHALRVTESPTTGSTPQAYIAWIRNLVVGDTVNVCFWAWDDTPGSEPWTDGSVRIWASYATDDIYDYQGSALGNPVYTSGIGWEFLCWSWVFDGGADTLGTSLVIQMRLYSPYGAGSFPANSRA